MLAMAFLRALLLWWSVQPQWARDFGVFAEDDGSLPSSLSVLPLVASRFDFSLSHQSSNHAHDGVPVRAPSLVERAATAGA